MKRVFPVLLILLTGCIVQSFYPFCTDKSKVVVPQLNGQWDAVTAWGNPVSETNIPPWQISDDQILTYDSNSHPGRIQVTFFKLRGQLFCSSTTGGREDNASDYWVFHTRPVYTVTKVDTNADVLMFTPLDLGWLTNAIATGRASLPHLTLPRDDWPLFTAKPSDWEKFLTKYANSTDAFPTNHVYVVKRHVAAVAK